MEIGVYTFAELRGSDVSPEQRVRNLLEEIVLADQVGLDVFGAPPARLRRLVVGRGPRRRRRAHRAATPDERGHCAQLGRPYPRLPGFRDHRPALRRPRRDHGRPRPFIESFPLFGYELEDYDRLFAEKLEQLLELRLRSSELGVYPAPGQEPLPIWVAVGGNPQSAIRAGALGLAMALAIIGGQPERFAPFAELHREAARRAGRDPPAAAIVPLGTEVAPAVREEVATPGLHAAPA